MANLLFYVPDSTPAAIGGIDSFTKLMLHMDGDQSDSSHSVAHTGNPQFTTVQSKFGEGSMYFDGSGDYLAVPDSNDWDFGAGDFTIDVWVYITAIPQPEDSNIFSRGIEYSAFTLQIIDGAASTIQMLFAASSTGASFDLNTGWFNIGDIYNQWSHIAVVRYGNDWNIYIDGALIKTINQSFTIRNTSDPLSIGYYRGSGTDYRYLQGYMDEFRISNVARWTADFSSSLPSEPYTSDANTKLLLHMEGDVSTSAHVVTTNGDSRLNTTTTKFDGAMYFDGTGDYLSMPDDDDWYLGSTNFTTDFWLRITTLGQTDILWEQYPGGNPYQQFVWSGTINQLVFIVYPSGCEYRWGWTPSADTWYHIALVRNSTTMMCFVDGVEQSKSEVISIGTKTLTNVSASLTIGARNDGSLALAGYIDEFRWSKGVARWTTDFTPETGPYTE